MASMLFRLLLTALCCVLLYSAVYVDSVAISSSQIQYCTRTSDEPPNCKKKMIMTVVVDGGQKPDAEEVVALSTAEDKTKEKDGKPGDPTAVANFEPIRITVSRSQVRYRYPVFYVQDFNAKPSEQYVTGSFVDQCNADFDADTATCGLQYDDHGRAIPYSQGFCCDCSLCQTLGFCATDSRVYDSCQALGAYTTAFCLRFGKYWYAGYKISGYSLWYTINVTVKSDATPNTKAVLHLSPDQKGDSTTEYGVVAQLIGELSPSEQPLDLATHMLFVPSRPYNDPRVLAGPREWLIVNKNLVSLDGKQCDRIGVSYEAYASQGNACKLNKGSCLNSQLEDYRTADMKAVLDGRKGQYMSVFFGEFDFTQFAVDGAPPMPYITYVAQSPAPTIVTLTINADDLQYIVNVASGRIVSAEVKQKTIQASTNNGEMLVTVQNTGSVTARFTVSVTECTGGVFPITAQGVTLQKGEQKPLLFNVLMQDPNMNGPAQCNVTLRNALELVVDSKIVHWTVNHYTPTDGMQGGSAGADNPDVHSGSNAARCKTCGWMNVSCAFGQRCPKPIALQLGLLAALVLLVILIFCCRHQLVSLFGCCFHSHHHHRRDSKLGGGEESAAAMAEMAALQAILQQQQQMQEMQVLQTRNQILLRTAASPVSVMQPQPGGGRHAAAYSTAPYPEYGMPQPMDDYAGPEMNYYGDDDDNDRAVPDMRQGTGWAYEPRQSRSAKASRYRANEPVMNGDLYYYKR